MSLSSFLSAVQEKVDFITRTENENMLSGRGGAMASYGFFSGYKNFVHDLTDPDNSADRNNHSQQIVFAAYDPT